MIKNAFTWLSGGVLIALPVFLRPDVNAELSRLDGPMNKSFLFMFSAILAGILFGVKKAPAWLTCLVATFSIWAFLFPHNPYSATASEEWLMISAGGLLLLVAASNKESGSKELLLNFMAVACLIQGLWFMCQWAGVEPYGLYLEARGLHVVYRSKINDYIIGSLHNQTWSGAFLAATMPALLRKRWVYLAVIPLFAAYVCGSAMTWLGIVGGVFGYFAAKDRKLSLNLDRVLVYASVLAFGAAVVLSGIGLDHDFWDDQGRFFVWARVLDFVSGWEILLGKGSGSFGDLFPLFQPMSKRWVHPHNEFLWIYSTFGLMGLGVIFYGIKRFLKLPRKDPHLIGVLAALMFNSVGNFPLHVAPVAWVGILALGYIIGENQGGSSNGAYLH